MKKIICVMSVIILSVIFVGCGPRTHLVKDDVTPEQVQQDNSECELEGTKATQFMIMQGILVQGVAAMQAKINCLQSKGYTYEKELTEQEQLEAKRKLKTLPKDCPYHKED